MTRSFKCFLLFLFMSCASHANADVPDPPKRRAIFVLPKVGFGMSGILLSDIPDDIRTVHPYEDPGNSQRLSKNRFGFSTHLLVGFGVLDLRRLDMGLDLTYRYSYVGHANPFIQVKNYSGTYIGYDIRGLTAMPYGAIHIHRGLYVKAGYQYQFATLRSGADADAQFHVQHETGLHALVYAGLLARDLDSDYCISPPNDPPCTFGSQLELGAAQSIGGGPWETILFIFRINVAVHASHQDY